MSTVSHSYRTTSAQKLRTLNEIVLPLYPSEGLPSRPARAYARLRMICIEETADERAQRGPVLRVGQRELDERAEVRVDVADVETALRAPQTDPVDHTATLDEQPDGVGELDLAAL